MSRPALLATLAALVGAAAIVFTYPVLTATFDEPAHLAAGIDWLDRGAYPRHTIHPPLARTLIAVGPYLAGVRSVDGPPEEKEIGILYQGGRYRRNLSLARLGSLPFYLLASFVVWSWGRRLWGRRSAAGGVLLFASLPPVLGHGGLATTDMAACATTGLTLYLFVSWLEAPTLRASLALGFSLGLALLAKVSALLFVPAGGLLVLILHRAVEPGRRPFPLRRLALGGLAALLVVWSGYRFSVEALADPGDRPHDPIDRVVGTSGAGHDLAYRLAEAPVVPAASFLRSVNLVRALNERGFGSYILGRRLEDGGVWYFFPVALAVKTPLPFLLLALAGSLWSVRRGLGEREGALLAPVAAALGILGVAMLSDVNLGVRHVLPVYVPLAVAAAGALPLLGRYGAAGRGVAGILLLWQIGDAAAAHPDHLAYFNAAVGRPEEVLVESDLDWGQDLGRLARVLEREGIDRVSIAYFGTADLSRSGLPAHRILGPGERASGWIAVSRTLLKMGPGYAWLDRRTPERVVGKSIELHLVPEPE